MSRQGGDRIGIQQIADTVRSICALNTWVHASISINTDR